MLKRFKNEHSSCYTVLEENCPKNGTYLILYEVQTEEGHTGKGSASRMLKEVLDYAKSLHIPVRLFVKNYYHRTLNDFDLIKWYNKNGFNVDNLYDYRNIWMVSR